MEIHGKAVATVVNDPDKDYGEWGGFTAVLSTPALDRDGDRLHRDEWIEPLGDRYPLDIDHGMSVEDTVGSFHPYFDGDYLMMDAYFASTDKAQDVRRLVDEKHIRSVSVAFLTDKSKKDGEPSRELLNAGIVAIPSNRDAIILHSKGLAEQLGIDRALEAPEVDSKAPSGTGDGPALTQAIHDASVHLGAMCYPLPEPDADNTGASDGANKSAKTGNDDDEEEENEEDDNKKVVTFTNASGQTMEFNSHEDAREFFTDMIKSLDDPELVAAGALPEEKALVLPEGMTQEQFKFALKAILTPNEAREMLGLKSPEEPAPADEAAAAPSADDWATKAAVLRMRHRLHRN